MEELVASGGTVGGGTSRSTDPAGPAGRAGSAGSPGSTATAVSTGTAEMLAAAGNGDRLSLARLLTMVERGGDGAREVAAAAYRTPARARTIGITGSPGAGKSTLVDKLVSLARSSGSDQVAVIAVDPTSPYSGGAILGDRVRMQGHAGDGGVFIRSMATRGHLGGLSAAVPEAMRLLEACHMDPVIVETVGVGQVEIEVASAAGTVVVVVNPGWGDSIQANKAGILEIADILVVNKADRPGAKEAVRDLEQMLDMAQERTGWRPPVLQTVASTGEGVDALWDEMRRHDGLSAEGGELSGRRRSGYERSLTLAFEALLRRSVAEAERSPLYLELLDEMEAGRMDPYEAAGRLFAASGDSRL